MRPERSHRRRWLSLAQFGMLGIVLMLSACLNRWDIPAGSYRPLPDGVKVTPVGTLLASGTVVKVNDADTLAVLGPDRNVYKIRLQGIDAPENKQNYGQHCAAKLRRLATDQRVTVEAYKKDRYQRIVAKVSLGGQDLALAMIRQGCGWHYTAYASEQSAADQQAYARAESEARRRKIGLWRAARPQAPWEYRQQYR